MEAQKHTADEPREAFEKWAVNNGYDISPSYDRKSYWRDDTNKALTAWQARGEYEAGRAETGQAKASEGVDMAEVLNHIDSAIRVMDTASKAIDGRVYIIEAINRLGDTKVSLSALPTTRAETGQAKAVSIDKKAFSAAIDVLAGEFPPESGITIEVLRRLCTAYESAKSQPLSPDKCAETGLVKELSVALEHIRQIAEAPKRHRAPLGSIHDIAHHALARYKAQPKAEGAV